MSLTIVVGTVRVDDVAHLELVDHGITWQRAFRFVASVTVSFGRVVNVISGVVPVVTRTHSERS